MSSNGLGKRSTQYGYLEEFFLKEFSAAKIVKKFDLKIQNLPSELFLGLLIKHSTNFLINFFSPTKTAESWVDFVFSRKLRCI